jgi:guanine deaminase
LRGTVLLPDTAGRVTLLDDAVVRWADGRITDVVAMAPGASSAGTTGGRPVDTDLLIVPGFVDLHCHWPQAHVRGAFSGQLLDWLRESIWPAEAAFVDLAIAAGRAAAFLDDAVHAGTCAGMLFGPPFLEASLTLLEMAPRGFFDGPALMEINGPEALLRPVAATLDALPNLKPDVLRRIAVSPRFAPTITAQGLRQCGVTAANLNLAVQSHLSENAEEVAWVRSLFPDARDYTDVYDQAGLLGPRTVLAHAIHVGDRELDRLAATGTIVAHCPTSNEALGSGRMPLARLRAAGVNWVLATDVGAGPKLSQLDTMRAFLDVHGATDAVTATEALCRSTAIPGAFLASRDPMLAGLGTLSPGAPAHVVALPRPAGKLDAEGVLRALLRTPRNALDTLPTRVVLWGEAL